MRKITETNGDTDWLKDGAAHCNVRREYYDTDRGVKKITDVVDIVEDEHPVSQCYWQILSLASFEVLALYWDLMSVA